MEPYHVEDYTKMIEDLKSVGIEVKPVLMAFVPENMGTRLRNDYVQEVISVSEAHRIYCSEKPKDAFEK